MQPYAFDADFDYKDKGPLFQEIGAAAHSLAMSIQNHCPDSHHSNASRHKQIALTTLRTALYSANMMIAQYEKEQAAKEGREPNLSR